MKAAFFAIVVFALVALASNSANAQGKGIDTQNKQIRDIGNNQGPTDNGNNKNVGTGRGFDFGAGKTPDRVILSNPYRLPSKRDILLATISSIMQENGLMLDDSASRAADGILVAQPFTFSRGAVVTGSQLARYAVVPDNEINAWTRGRYTLRVEVQSIDGTNNNVSVTAKVEGRAEDSIGSRWLTLESSGLAEQDFLNLLVERVTGKSPNAAPQPRPESSDKTEPKPPSNL
jgi:hypothetical protein